MRRISRAIYFMGMLGFFGPGKGALAEEVYRSDFGKVVRAEVWSNTKTKELVPGGERILGPLGRQLSTSLTLKDLPDHLRVRVSFDLLTFGVWDGVVTDKKGTRARDSFCVSVKDGPLLVATTICDWKPGTLGRQSFPDEWPTAGHPPQTGRAPGAPGDTPRYQFALEFPHSGKDLVLFFRGNSSSSKDTWGYSNVRVEVFDEFKKVAPEDADRLWDALRAEDVIKANRAVWEWIAAGEAGWKELEKKWDEWEVGREGRELAVAAEFEKRWKEAVEKLDSKEFAERRKGALEIEKLGLGALHLIEDELKFSELAVETRTLFLSLKEKIGGLAKGPKWSGLDSLVASRIAHVRRVVARGNKAGMRVTSSKIFQPGEWSGPSAVIDGFVPPSSAVGATPRFSWFPRKEGEGWLRVDFEAERKVSKFGVYWLIDGRGVSAPAKWRIEYLTEDGLWKEVLEPDGYPTEADKVNEMTFDEVSTRALRIIATMDGEKSVGVQEIFVE